MQLDIRIPIGGLFTMVGLILSLYGIVGDRAADDRALGHNVNLGWGLALLAFGLVFLYFARRGARPAHPSA